MPNWKTVKKLPTTAAKPAAIAYQYAEPRPSLFIQVLNDILYEKDGILNDFNLDPADNGCTVRDPDYLFLETLNQRVRDLSEVVYLDPLDGQMKDLALDLYKDDLPLGVNRNDLNIDVGGAIEDFDAIKAAVDQYLATHTDLSKPLTAKFYRLKDQLALVNDIRNKAENLPRYNDEQLQTFGQAAAYMNLDPFTQGLVPLGDDPSPAETAAYANCLSLIGQYNANLDEMGKILDAAYEDYRKTAKLPTDGELGTYKATLPPQELAGKTDKELGEQMLRERFEAEYYRKFWQYQADQEGLDSFRTTLTGLLAAHHLEGLQEKVANDAGGEEYTLDEKCRIIALLERPGKKLHDSIDDRLDALSRRVDALREQPEGQLEELFHELYKEPLAMQCKQLSDTDAKYQFSRWQTFRSKQDTLLTDLTEAQSRLTRARVEPMVAGVPNFLRDGERRSRIFYATAHQQLLDLKAELAPMSTRAGGNSDQFTDMLNFVNGIGDFPETFAKAQKDRFNQKLDAIASAADNYVRAKRAQKGLPEVPTANDKREPKFGTTQGRKRYEYAKKVRDLVNEIKSSLAMAEQSLAQQMPLYEQLNDQFGVGSGEKLLEDYQRYAAQVNIPSYVSQLTHNYRAQENLKDKAILKQKLGLVNNDISNLTREIKSLKNNSSMLKKSYDRHEISQDEYEEQTQVNEAQRLEKQEQLHLKHSEKFHLYHDHKEAERRLAKDNTLRAARQDTSPLEITSDEMFKKTNDKLKEAGLSTFKLSSSEHTEYKNRLEKMQGKRQAQRTSPAYQKAKAAAQIKAQHVVVPDKTDVYKNFNVKLKPVDKSKAKQPGMNKH